MTCCLRSEQPSEFVCSPGIAARVGAGFGMNSVRSLISEESARKVLIPLRDFTPRDDRGELWNRASVAVRIEPGALPVPALALMALEIAGCKNLGRDEKTAWQIPFGFDGVNATLTSQKFGVRMYVAADSAAADKLAKRVIAKLQAAVAVLEREVLHDLAAEQLAAGKVTVENQTPQLSATYSYFRERAQAEFERADVATTVAADLTVDGLTEAVSRSVRHSEVGSWQALAAVNAYFSLLEHRLVLYSAFTGFDPRGSALLELIGLRWREKFKRLFDVGEPSAKAAYEKLHGIAETYRNTYSHGNFEKSGASLFVHVDGLGALPARLTDIRTSPQFDLFPFHAESFARTCGQLDEVEKWILDGPYGLADRFVKTGIHVAFDAKTRSAYLEATEDAAQMEQLIEREGFIADRNANMDW